MIRGKTIFALFAVVGVSVAQNISISGTVTDTGSTPLPGAAVRLEKRGITATTGSDGAFTLTGVGINGNGSAFPANTLSAFIRNGVVHLHMPDKGPVEIITYTLKGKIVCVWREVVAAGGYRVSLPQTGNGVYVHRVRSGAAAVLLKSSVAGRMHGTGGSAMGAGNVPSSITAQASSRYVPIEDVIAVVKEGYLNYRVIVTNSDTGDIEIKMIACADTVRDIDGNLYQAVRIGNQVWLAENLRVTRYNDGTTIPQVSDNAEWSKLTTPGYCFYNNTTNLDTIKTWGALYNWYVISPIYPKIAPSGWRVPDTTDWNTLETHLITNGYNFDGTTTGNKIASSMAARADWLASAKTGAIGESPGQNNRSGFTAVSAGSRSDNGYYNYRNVSGFWWACIQSNPTFAWSRELTSSLDNLGRYTYYKRYGFSIRLVRDVGAVEP